MSQMKEGLWNKGIPGRGHGICYGLEVEEGVPAVGELAARQGGWVLRRWWVWQARGCLARQGFESLAWANPSSACELQADPAFIWISIL